MEAFQQRVVDEHIALIEKCNKLEDFMAGSVYNDLPEVDRLLLDCQYRAMIQYAIILSERIKRFPA